MRALLLLGCVIAVSGCNADNCDDGNICTWFGEPGVAGASDDGTHRLAANTFWPTDLNFRPSDNQPVILDWNNHKIIRLDDKQKLVTISGVGGELGDGPPGPALEATWNHPTDVAWLSDGTMVLAAWHNSRIAEFSPDYTTMDWLAGTGGRDFSGDGGDAAAALLDLPCGIRVDDQDNVYIADMANQRIRQISPDGMIQTVAGNGEHGYNGDGGALEVSFASPALQRAEPAFKMDMYEGDIYVADTHNGRVRRFDIDAGTVETVAGMGQTPENSDNGTVCDMGCGYGGDGGPATEAMLNTPSDIAIASDGTIYIADTDNSCIRVVDPDGNIDTFAGVCGEQGYDGENVPANEALLARPFGVTVDNEDAVYISDTYNNIIRRVVPL